jgi:glutamate mutase epsilon subunit
MKIKPQIAILLALIIFAAGITITSMTGLWTTISTKTPDKLEDVEFAGAYDPNDIRGSYTFFEISELYKIPLAELSEAFGVELAKAKEFKCKDLETIYADAEFEIGTASVKMFAAYYLGLPYEPSEEVYLTEIAAQILVDKGNMTQEQLDYLESHTIPAP